MHKLIVVIRRPSDPATFEDRWSQEFVPRAERMPGLRRVTLSRVVGGLPEAMDIHLIHEFYFDHLAALQSAMASPEGQAAGRALMAFAAREASLSFAEHMEMDLTDRGRSA
jgi:uncharacterized protein (TIGR02118 family)